MLVFAQRCDLSKRSTECSIIYPGHDAKTAMKYAVHSTDDHLIDLDPNLVNAKDHDTKQEKKMTKTPLCRTSRRPFLMQFEVLLHGPFGSGYYHFVSSICLASSFPSYPCSYPGRSILSTI